jgi:hypothetical protein
MAETIVNSTEHLSIKHLPCNVWTVGFTSFFMDISSEMAFRMPKVRLENPV